MRMMLIEMHHNSIKASKIKAFKCNQGKLQMVSANVQVSDAIIKMPLQKWQLWQWPVTC